MKVLSLFQEFDISIYKLENWEFGSHKHSFFEIIYILEGKGSHIINQNSFLYEKGNMYFLTPNDEHSFELQTETEFCVISFNKIYFSKEKSKNQNLIDFSELFKKIEIILSNTHYLQQNIFQEEEEKLFISQLISKLVIEAQKQEPFFETVIQNTVFLILSLIARNVNKKVIGDSNQKSNSEISEIVFYIQNNIYNNDKLRITELSNVFNKSNNHLSAYFKSQTGLSIKDYILDYKLSLIKNRLEFSELTISQIAYELGFTDESHLNKIFKSRFYQTAKEFRKSIKLAID